MLLISRVIQQPPSVGSAIDDECEDGWEDASGNNLLYWAKKEWCSTRQISALSALIKQSHDAEESTSKTVASAGEIRKSMMESEMTDDLRHSLLSQHRAGPPTYRDQGQYKRAMSHLQDGKRW